LTLSVKTLSNLGWKRTLKIAMSYMAAKIKPISNERSLADFFINRFGRELYATFFKDYTEKVWGVPCEKIPRDWGAQRVKGLSVTSAVLHALKRQVTRVDSHKVETSLIEQFHYPKYGPGQLWEEVAQRITTKGGTIYLNTKVVGIMTSANSVTGVIMENAAGERRQLAVDYLLSSMPVKELIGMMSEVPGDVRQIADGLSYRDFITVGLLLDKKHAAKLPDNWIYVQEPELKVGRIQVFNNWSPYLVDNQHNLWLGLEYFCQEEDDLWQMDHEALKQLAVEELMALDIIDGTVALLDATVIKVKKAYPAYFGTYHRFQRLKGYVSGFHNLFLIGRNGQHRYNNMDHSMLTAMTAVEVLNGRHADKDAIWQINTEEVYHEKKQDRL
jgi:protoporphyrinogen oxidase